MAGTTATSPTTQLAGFIAKFDPAMQRRIRAIRAALRKRFPTANELVYDNYNFFVIGYSSTERPSDAIVSMAANSKGVGLCFIYGASLPDPQQRLAGAAARRASSGCRVPRRSPSPRSRRCSGPRSPSLTRRCRGRSGQADHPIDLRETAAEEKTPGVVLRKT